MDVSLVVTDLDGTLWHRDHHIEPAVLDAWAAIVAKGIPVLVATGRRRSTTLAPLARFGLRPPAIVLNGALGVDADTGDRFHLAPFASNEASAVLTACRAVGVEPVVYIDDPDVEVVLDPSPSTHPDHVLSLRDGARTGDLAQACAEEAVLGFSVLGIPFAQGEAIAASIGDRSEVHLDASIEFEGLASLTVAPKHQSKWDGVLAYCRVHGLDPGAVLALADGANDLELLDGAAIGLVPTNAHPEALSRADHRIPAAADGGWAHVLDHL